MQSNAMEWIDKLTLKLKFIEHSPRGVCSSSDHQVHIIQKYSSLTSITIIIYLFL